MIANDTIVATATPVGVGALAIVRMSGENSARILALLTGEQPGPARVAVLRRLRAKSGEILDEAIVIRYEAPHSYTGENAVEVVCHGGIVTATRITQEFVAAGARPAQPGEFTRRAVMNGRLDLLQAEAVNDLIWSRSTAGATLALRQLDGGLSRRVLQLREDILGLEALAAYEIDFPEEDDGPVDDVRIRNATDDLVRSIQWLIDTTPAGELVRHGAVVAIVGAPNVGKSSMFNALLGRQRALVTDVPGTTRDALEAVLDTVPVPLRLVDTAGLRETSDQVEQLGVTLTREYVRNAAAVLACGDSEETLVAAREEAERDATGVVIPVQTKRDLKYPGIPGALGVSAVTGEGLERLVGRVSELIAQKAQLPDAESPVVTHTRYREVLERALHELTAFQSARGSEDLPATVSAVHLRESARILEELVGGIDVEDVLGRVFSSFCVGK